MTVREIISLVKNELNGISLDVRKSNRFIYNKILIYADIIIKRESDNRRLFNNTDVFSKIDCFDLIETSVSCNVYLPCKNFMKSKLPLPTFYSSIYGNLLIVSTIDDSNRFEQTTPENYKNILNREFKPKTGYYWIDNNHLIIPNSSVETVSLRYLSKHSIKTCKSLDENIGIPGWLISDVIKYTVVDIRNTSAIPQDEDPNLNSNDKS